MCSRCVQGFGKLLRNGGWVGGRKEEDYDYN